MRLNPHAALATFTSTIVTFALTAATPALSAPATTTPTLATSGTASNQNGSVSAKFSWAKPASEGSTPGSGSPRSANKSSAPRPDPWAAYNERIRTCGEPIDSWCMLWALEVAPAVGVPGSTSAPRPPTRTDAEAVAREVILTLKVAKPTPRIAPRTTERDGNMMVVGYPLWLWAEDGNTASTTETRYGLTFTLDARRDKTVFDMGDGFVVTCLATTPYEPTTAPGTPSPTCGHRYRKASLPRGTYTVTATSHWTVTWSGLGFSGTLPLTSSDSVHIPVGELQSVVTG